MGEPAIRIEGLGKMYRISHETAKHVTFPEAVARALTAPFRNLRELSDRGGETEAFWALRDVSFDVAHGEVIGIVGSNGAGKSTLLKILSRIVEPTEGRAVLRGRVASLLEVGTGFHQELTGRENIFLNGSIMGMKRVEIDAKFDEIVEFAEIEKFLDTPVKRYSSGMYVRLAFAVAAHLEPDILVVDEVLAVGDAEFQRKCLGKMREQAARGGRTVLFVSHNMAAVRSLCQSALLLERGKVVAHGPAETVVAQYIERGLGVGVKTEATLDRPSGAPLWMTKAKLVVNSGRANVLCYGATATLRIEFRADPPVSRVYLGFVLTGSDGTRLVCANNRYQDTKGLTSAAESGAIEAELGSVPLMAGRYSVSLYIGDERTDSHVELDVLSFEVVERDIWGQGRVPPSGAAAMWWPATFRRIGGAE